MAVVFAAGCGLLFGSCNGSGGGGRAGCFLFVCYWCGDRVKVLKDLVLLKYLVKSISYALNKNLICSKINYLKGGKGNISKTTKARKTA